MSKAAVAPQWASSGRRNTPQQKRRLHLRSHNSTPAAPKPVTCQWRSNRSSANCHPLSSQMSASVPRRWSRISPELRGVMSMTPETSLLRKLDPFSASRCTSTTDLPPPGFVFSSYCSCTGRVSEVARSCLRLESVDAQVTAQPGHFGPPMALTPTSETQIGPAGKRFKPAVFSTIHSQADRSEYPCLGVCRNVGPLSCQWHTWRSPNRSSVASRG